MPTNRGLTNRVAISNAIDKELHTKLKAYSKETKIPMSKLLDKAVEMLLESVGRA